MVSTDGKLRNVVQWVATIAVWWRHGQEVRFAPDSPQEGAVQSELVSEVKFPASWENTGNFASTGSKRTDMGRKSGSCYSSLETNSLRFRTGNLFALNRELEDPIRELECLIREHAESLYITSDATLF
jgi:hypothetical protein